MQTIPLLLRSNTKHSFPGEKVMPEISVQHHCAALTDLVGVESFGEPIGELPKQTDSGFFQEGNLTAGTWECEPGTLQLDLDITEFCHLLTGHWVLTSESGVVTEIRAGDSWIFPNGWKGTAEVRETVRKVYMIIS
jgi:uncharacterized cupin superfamily protein